MSIVYNRPKSQQANFPMSLKHTLLTLLETEPGSGYDLLKRFRSRLGYFWNASHQQIYQQLKQMLRDELIEFELKPQTDKPDSKIYTVTSTGHKELLGWLKQPVKPSKINDALLVKLYAGKLLDKAVLIAEMAKHREVHANMLNTFLELEQEFLSTPKANQEAIQLPYLTLRRGILGEQAWLVWADEVHAELIK